MSERGLRADLTSVAGLRGNPGPPPAMSVVLHVFEITTVVKKSVLHCIVCRFHYSTDNCDLIFWRSGKNHIAIKYGMHQQRMVRRMLSFTSAFAPSKYPEVPESTQKYLKVPKSTWKYPEVPQNIQKYLQGLRSTLKYPEVPQII